MDPLIIVVILGAIVAGFVQGLSGFAYGLVAMSFWAWAVDPHIAAAMAVFGALTGQILAAVTIRRKLNLKQLAPFVAGGLAGIPIGLCILPQLDANLFKALLGLLLVAWCPVMLMARQLPQIKSGGRLADSLIGAIGGILSAIGGIAGAVPALWCTLRGLDKEEQRAIIQNFNLTILFVTMVSYIATGIVTVKMLPMFAIVAPAMLIPTLLGTRLYIGISAENFRRIVLGLLTASGLALLASSVPQLILRLA